MLTCDQAFNSFFFWRSAKVWGSARVGRSGAGRRKERRSFLLPLPIADSRARKTERLIAGYPISAYFWNLYCLSSLFSTHVSCFGRRINNKVMACFSIILGQYTCQNNKEKIWCIPLVARGIYHSPQFCWTSKRRGEFRKTMITLYFVKFAYITKTLSKAYESLNLAMAWERLKR